ncbi:MAG: ASCH domain-containing protein [Nanoarchaeota archaeon]|nr:ASCH domain-containing protein [Nanoarchaeota archaeon]
MEHIAIMKKSWKLIPKILSGEKKIESRWYKIRHLPWNSIQAGETVYFKDSGEPIALKAEVEKIMQFSDLNPQKVNEILSKYGKGDGLGVYDIPKFFKMFMNKKYCILIFLSKPEKIKSFNIDKTGFGMMSAWITLDSVNRIKIKDPNNEGGLKSNNST